MVLFTALPPYRLTAQSATLSGRLVRVRGADTTALAGLWVIAHQVSERRQGPVDSMRTDARGGFRFVVARPDSGAILVASARYQGIGYFSEPRQAANAREPVVLAVFDTAAAGPPLAVGIRHVVITRGETGQRRVLDIMQVVNPGAATRVGRDSLTAVWSARLPDGALTPQPGEGEIPATAIRFEDGRAVVTAPFPPGIKQVVFTYDLRPGAAALTIPIDQATERLEVLVEDSSATASADLHVEDPVAIEGRTFRRFSADSLRAGRAPRLTFGATRGDPRRFAGIAIAVAGLTLALGGAFALRRKAGDRGAGRGESGLAELAQDSDERLAAQIAALDAKFAGREASTEPAAWGVYQRRREALKSELDRRVARA